MYRCLRSLALLLLLTPSLAAEQQGVIVSEARVYDAPAAGARKLGTLQAGTRVNLFGRQGGWEEVFVEQEELIGWVRSYQVRAGDYAPRVDAGTQADSRGFLSGLAAFSRKASRFFAAGDAGTSAGTATIGVRGLSEAEIKSAKPDPVELQKMQGFASNQQRLASFRDEGQLKANSVKHLKPKQKFDE